MRKNVEDARSHELSLSVRKEQGGSARDLTEKSSRMAGPGGRKRKRSYNTSGFKHQTHVQASPDPSDHSCAPSSSDDED